MSTTRTKSSSTEVPGAKPPVVNVTRYDTVSSFLLAIVAALVIAVVWLSAMWAANHVSEPEESTELEILEMPGGVPDGVPGESLGIDSDADVTDDPSVAEIPGEESDVQEMMENVVDMAEEATTVAASAQQEFNLQIIGKPGRSIGTGRRRGLGEGPGNGGFPREQRWFVRFSEQGSLAQYAQQLQSFGVELGALMPGGKLIYLSNLTAEKPAVRTANSGKGENRLYMTWRGGSRRGADQELFKKAGVDSSSATLFHFYPPETEKVMAKLEHDYAGKPVTEIRRTYFAVRSSSGKFEFYVTRQSYR